MRWYTLTFVVVATVVLQTATASAQYSQTILAQDPFVYFRLQEPNASHTTAAINSTTQAGFANGTYLIHSGNPANGSFVDVSSIGNGNDPGKQFNRLDIAHGAYIASDQPAAVGNLGAFTMSFLIRPEDYTINDFQALYATNGFGPGAVHLNINPGGDLALAVSGYSSFPAIDLESLVPLGEWAHVAITYENSGGSNTTKYYVNGELIDTVARAESYTADFDTPAAIGSWLGNSRFFQGGLDEFAIFDRALSAEEIQAQANALVPEPSSIACWSFLAFAAMFLAWLKRHK